MQGKIVLITGATDGIGKQTALELAKLGAHVVLHGRNSSRGQQVLQEIKSMTGNDHLDFVQADLASLQEVRQMARHIKARYSALHVLINNAGVFEPNFKQSRDGFEMTFAVNYLAHFLLTCLLLDLLCRSAPARIINVSSMAHSQELDFEKIQTEESYSGYRAYSYSKLMNILFTFKLASLLDKNKVTVNCLHPGVIDTKLLRAGWGGGGVSVEEGAKTSVYLASALELQKVSGIYFSNLRPAHPAAIAFDEKIQDRLWQMSTDLCACHFEEALKDCNEP